jgi:hypothetical protein
VLANVQHCRDFLEDPRVGHLVLGPVEAEEYLQFLRATGQ